MSCANATLDCYFTIVVAQNQDFSDIVGNVADVAVLLTTFNSNHSSWHTLPSRTLPCDILESVHITVMDSDNNESIIFHVQSPLEAAGARVGSLTVHNQQTIKTPHYIAISSRGCVPHVTQDNLCRRTGVCGMHVALEDCEPPR